MIGWLIATAYVAVGLMVSKKTARDMASIDDGYAFADPEDRMVVAFFSLFAGIFWPVTVLFWGFTAWLLPRKGGAPDE